MQDWRGFSAPFFLARQDATPLCRPCTLSISGDIDTYRFILIDLGSGRGYFLGSNLNRRPPELVGRDAQGGPSCPADSGGPPALKTTDCGTNRENQGSGCRLCHSSRARSNWIFQGAGTGITRGPANLQSCLPNLINSSSDIFDRRSRALNDLLWINQHRDVEPNDVRLEFRAFVGLDDAFNHHLIDFASLQICANFVADPELTPRLFVAHGTGTEQTLKSSWRNC